MSGLPCSRCLDSPCSCLPRGVRAKAERACTIPFGHGPHTITALSGLPASCPGTDHWRANGGTDDDVADGLPLAFIAYRYDDPVLVRIDEIGSTYVVYHHASAQPVEPLDVTRYAVTLDEMRRLQEPPAIPYVDRSLQGGDIIHLDLDLGTRTPRISTAAADMHQPPPRFNGTSHPGGYHITAQVLDIRYHPPR